MGIVDQRGISAYDPIVALLTMDERFNNLLVGLELPFDILGENELKDLLIA